MKRAKAKKKKKTDSENVSEEAVQPKKKYRLRVLAGAHRERVGAKGRKAIFKVYKAGDIIESDRPLHKIFKNKFAPADQSGLKEDAKAYTGPAFQVVELEVDGEIRYNIINPALDEAINAKPLTAKKVEAFTGHPPEYWMAEEEDEEE